MFSSRATGRTEDGDGGGTDAWLTVAIVASWIVAAAVGVIRTVAASPADRGPGAVLSSVTFALVLATPGAVAVIGRRSHTPSLVIAAGVSLVPLGLVSIAAFPLLVPAAMLVVGGVRLRGRSGAVAVLVSCTLVVTSVAALVVMLVHQDPPSVQTPTMGAGVSDVVTPWESLAALSLVAVTLGLAELAALSRRRRAGVRSGAADR